MKEAKMEDLKRYFRHNGLAGETAETVLQILAEWQEKGITFWPKNDSNPKDWARSEIILGGAIEREWKVWFFAPVCPEYPESRTGELGTGIFEANRPFIPLSRILVDSLAERKVEFTFDFILADTETDLSEIVVRLAGSEEEFLARCNKSVVAFRKEVPSGVMVHSFSEFFKGCWHQVQYFWEERVRQEMRDDEKFRHWLELLSWQRAEKYERQFGRKLTLEECLNMVVRHYAQYSVLGYWMRQYPGAILLNTDSPNLRAIRRPLVLGKTPCQFVGVDDQHQRIPIIVP